MRTITVLCDRVGDVGGAERYWETVLPALASQRCSRALARAGDRAQTRRRASTRAHSAGRTTTVRRPRPPARAVADELRRERPDVVVTASVFDTAVLDAVRAARRRAGSRASTTTARSAPPATACSRSSRPSCSAPMGGACRGATIVRGCVHGPRPSSFRRIAEREALRDRLALADGVLVSSEHMRATCVANGIDAARIAITPPPLPDAAYAARAGAAAARAHAAVRIAPDAAQGAALAAGRARAARAARSGRSSSSPAKATPKSATPARKRNATASA